MADIKISQLPAATTPLAGTEEVPLVQSGTTKKVTVTNLRGSSVSAVTATAPVASSGGTTPNISMAAATGSVNGYLTSTDWTTFNSKQPAGSYLVSGGALGTPSSGTATNLTGLPLTTGVTGTLPVANGGTGTASPSIVAGTNVTVTGTWPNQTINATTAGTVTSVTGTSPIVSSGGTTPAISIPAATTSVSGYLTSTDWNTFNGKLSSGGALGTPSSGTATNLTGLPLTTGVTGVLPIANGGTNATTATAARGNILPSYTGNAGKVLAVNAGATDVEYIAASGSGTVTSVAVSGGTTGLTTSGGPITSAGTITLAGTLAVANGGTGTATPSIVAGTNVTVTGTWPNQTINATGGGGMTYPGAGIANSTGSAWGTSYTTTGTGTVVALATSPTFVTPVLGTPTSATLTNATGLPISTGVSGLGTGVATFLATPTSANLATVVTDETGSGSLVFATSPTLVTPALGTPSALVGTNITGTAAGLTAGNVTTNANLTGAVTSVGNATSLGSFTSANLAGALTDETGTGSAVFATSPTLVTPALGTPSALVGTNITGTAAGLTAGTVTTNANLTGAITSVGNATSLGSFTSANLSTALTDETGTGSAVFATSPTLVTPILGTPTSATLTNATGLPLSTGVTGTLPVANGGTGQTSYTDGQLLIGNSTGNTLTKATLTAGSNITVTNSSGAITIASTASGGVAYTAVKTANYTAANNDGVLTNTTGGAFTVTLPTSPSVGNQIIVADSFGTWGTNNLTIDPTALIKIAGQTAGTTLTCNINSVAITLVYTGATYGWDIFAQVGANDSSVLTQTNTVTGITNKTFVAPVLGAATASTLKATTTIGVGNATPSASGSGVSFPATQDPSTDANTLDDYEEGSWSPVITGSSGAGTYNDQAGTYVKVGKLVVVNFQIALSTKNTLAGDITLSNLPFTTLNNGGGGFRPSPAIRTTNLVSVTGTVGGFALVNSTNLQLQINNNGGSSNLNASNLPTSSFEIGGSFSYIAN